MTPTWALLTSVGVVFAVVLGAPEVGGVYTGALVLPELPLVVAPHPTDAITLASAIIRITPNIGFSPPRTDRQTRSTEGQSNDSAQEGRARLVMCLRCRAALL